MPPSPGYYDLQVNGYFGVDFNQNDLTPEDLHKACEHLEADGVAGILATIVTEHIPIMSTRLGNLVKMRAKDPLVARVIRGIHIEGPFINPQAGYRGAHPPDAIHPADSDEMQQLLEAAGGLTKIVTLAPEFDADLKVTRQLAAQGITVAGGHANPSLEQLEAAVDAGLGMWTHLGNGCPMQMHRHDNIVQRVLSMSDRITPCFIADGAHVAFCALKNYIRLVGVEHCIVVTDAIALAGLGPGKYKVSRDVIEVGPDMVTWSADRTHLNGCAAPMSKLVENLRQLGFTGAEIARLTIDNPKAFC